MMKKFINEKENLTKELLEGLEMSNKDIIKLVDGNLIVNKDLEKLDRVTIVSMGGTGHEPAVEGFVGNGMIDIAVCGDIFAAPGYQSVVKALQMADRGHGVLFVVLNHAGDMMSANLAMAEVAKLGLNVKKVVTQEDISNAPRSDSDNRRGLVGCVAVYKVAGALAQKGASLEEVTTLAQNFADNMATLAVAVKGATHPQTGMAISELGEDDMEIGMGQHGEGGGGRQPLASADKVAEIMTDALIKDLDLKENEKLMVFINGSGATTLMEQLIVYRGIVKHLETKKIEVVANFVGELLTVQEQAGFQLMFARMNDETIKLWEAPCNTPYMKRV